MLSYDGEIFYLFKRIINQKLWNHFSLNIVLHIYIIISSKIHIDIKNKILRHPGLTNLTCLQKLTITNNHTLTYLINEPDCLTIFENLSPLIA